MSPVNVPEVINNISITMLNALMKSEKTNSSASTRLAWTHITRQPSGVGSGNTQNDLKKKTRCSSLFSKLTISRYF